MAHADRSPLVSATKDDPARPYKAYVATAGTFLFALLAYWIADSDPFTLKDLGAGVLLAATTSGLTGVGTYRVENPKIRRSVAQK